LWLNKGFETCQAKGLEGFQVAEVFSWTSWLPSWLA